MTRIQYKPLDKAPNILASQQFIVSKNTIIQAIINQTDFTYRIIDQNLSVLIIGQASSLKQAKVNCRARLKELGVKVYDEIRSV